MTRLLRLLVYYSTSTQLLRLLVVARLHLVYQTIRRGATGCHKASDTLGPVRSKVKLVGDRPSIKEGHSAAAPCQAGAGSRKDTRSSRLPSTFLGRSLQAPPGLQPATLLALLVKIGLPHSFGGRAFLHSIQHNVGV